MSIVLFALIGATIETGPEYWICFGVYCMFRVLYLAAKFFQSVKEI